MNRSLAITVLTVIGVLVVGAFVFQTIVGPILFASPHVVEGARYGYHPGWGYGFFPLFGLLFPILFIFLIFGLVRAAFGGPRWGNGGPWMDRQTMAEEWHRRMHETTERRSEGGSERSGPSA